MRPFSARVDGGTRLRSAWIVVGVTAPRLTRGASGSVPIFTDHRSSPHCVPAGAAFTVSANEPTWLRPWPSLTVTWSVQVCWLPAVFAGVVHVGFWATTLLKISRSSGSRGTPSSHKSQDGLVMTHPAGGLSVKCEGTSRSAQLCRGVVDTRQPVLAAGLAVEAAGAG